LRLNREEKRCSEVVDPLYAHLAVGVNVVMYVPVAYGYCEPDTGEAEPADKEDHNEHEYVTVEGKFNQCRH